MHIATRRAALRVRAVAQTPDKEFLRDHRAGVWAHEYDLIPPGVLGAGAHGTVYAARQRSTGRDVAVKVAARHARPDREYANLVSVHRRLPWAVPEPVRYEGGQFPGLGYRLIVMELMPGGTLRDRLPDMTPAECDDFAGNLSRILHGLRREKLRHGDLHAKNVAFDAAGGVRVIDLASVYSVEEGADDVDIDDDASSLVGSMSRLCQVLSAEGGGGCYPARFRASRNAGIVERGLALRGHLISSR